MKILKIIIVLFFSYSVYGQSDTSGLNKIVEKRLPEGRRLLFYGGQPSQKMEELRVSLNKKNKLFEHLQDTLMAIALDTNQLIVDRVEAISLISDIESVRCLQFLVDHLDLEIPFRELKGRFRGFRCYISLSQIIKKRKNSKFLLELIFDSFDQENSMRHLDFSYYLYNEILGKTLALKTLKFNLSNSISIVEKKNIESLILLFEERN